MEEIRSKIDSETIYKVYDKKVTVSRGGDSLQIAYKNLEETMRIFKPEIQAEIRAIRDAELGQRCKRCDKFFISDRRRKYCSDECCAAAVKFSKRGKPVPKKKKKYKDPINEINAMARDLGLSYGQYQAMKYKEKMQW